jgi:hypothetical protein
MVRSPMPFGDLDKAWTTAALRYNLKARMSVPAQVLARTIVRGGWEWMQR